jgi:hypothetical protein
MAGEEIHRMEELSRKRKLKSCKSEHRRCTKTLSLSAQRSIHVRKADFCGSIAIEHNFHLIT